MVCSTPVYSFDGTPSHDSILRLNYGVIFKQLETFDVVTDTWHQLFVVSLPTVNRSLLREDFFACSSLEQTATDLRQGCDKIINLIHYLQNVTNRAVMEIDECIQYITPLVRELNSDTEERSWRRLGRGLFNFVGDISHALFGTARDTDLSGFSKSIQELNRRQGLMSTAWEKAESRLASFSKAANRRIDGMAHMLETQKTAVEDVFHTIRSEGVQQRQVNLWIVRALSRLENFVVLLEHLNSFKAGVEHLIAGFLSPELVPP